MTLFLAVLTLVVFLTIAALIVVTRALFALSDKIDVIVRVLSNQPESPRIKKESNNEGDVSSGLVKGLRQMRDDDEKHLKLLEMSRKLQRNPMPILNQNSASEDSFDTGGDLIPANLTQEELDVLRMFYEKRA
jgi:hypothetical protein